MDPRAQSKCEVGIIKSGKFTKKSGKFTTRVYLTFPTFSPHQKLIGSPGGAKKEIMSQKTPYLRHILLVCALAHVPPPPFWRELRKIWPSAHTKCRIILKQSKCHSKIIKKCHIPLFIPLYHTTQRRIKKVVYTGQWPVNSQHCQGCGPCVLVFYCWTCELGGKSHLEMDLESPAWCLRERP